MLAGGRIFERVHRQRTYIKKAMYEVNLDHSRWELASYEKWGDMELCVLDVGSKWHNRGVVGIGNSFKRGQS